LVEFATAAAAQYLEVESEKVLCEERKKVPVDDLVGKSLHLLRQGFGLYSPGALTHRIRAWEGGARKQGIQTSVSLEDQFELG
jgi:hypothetical protein